jgi:5-methylcytosine-specific restriction endonuclease McrA
MARNQKVLDIVSTDSTFERAEVRGEKVWVGRCIHCNARVVVNDSGETLATIEHIFPRTHGGTDDVENLALACRRCNGEKGVRHDNRHKNDPKFIEIVEALRAKKAARTRKPAIEPPPSPWRRE